MRLIKAFFRRISKDMKHRELFPLKILFFVHASVFFVLYPYLTIHMRELGINVEEVAIMSAVTPIVSIIMPPLAGLMADKIGNFKVLLAVFSSLGGVAALLLLLVPVGRVSITYPTTVDFSLSCPSSDTGIQRLTAIASQYSCDPLHPYAYDIDMTLENCGVSCHWPSDRINLLQKAVMYIVKIRNSEEETTQIFRYPLHTDSLSLDILSTYESSHKVLPNNMINKNSVVKLSQNMFFFPMNEIYGLNCENSEDNERILCSFGTNDTLYNIDQRSWIQNYTINAKVSPHSNETETDKVLPLSGFDIPKFVNKFQVGKVSNTTTSVNTSDSTDYKEAMCSDYFSTLEISVELLYEDTNNDTKSDIKILQSSETLLNCSSACMASTSRQSFCSNDKEDIDIDPTLTFGIYMCVRLFIAMVGGTAYAMFEGAVIAVLREQEGDYGLQKIYGIIGGMISSPLSGLLIDWASKGKGYTDFKPAFYLYALLKVFSGFLIMGINLDFKSPSSNVIKDVMSVLKNVEIVALFVVSLILGSLWGFIESFLFWFLQDLGGSRGLMGITVTIGGIAGIPLLVLSGPIINKLGHANIIFIGFIFYAIRLVGYSLIYDPWMCLIFEALEGVTTSLTFTAVVTYAARLSTTTTDTSVQGLLGGIYFGVGKGTGSLIGGYLMVSVGTRPTYQILAIAAVVTGIIYYIFNKLYLLKRPYVEGNDICKKPTKALKDIGRKKSEKNNEKSILNDKKINSYSENKNDLVNVYTVNDDKNEQILYSRDEKQNDASDICGLDNPSYVEDLPAITRHRNAENVELSRVDEKSKDGVDRVIERL